jgi:superfamily II DNA or RNA helicase
MKSFPDNIKFCYPWRTYQKRVLDELTNYLDDEKLHIIAPPGSGKTVLALEVLIRLNQPTLILAPTITIKNQWIDRLVDLFLPEGSKNIDWISTDIKNPAFLTVWSHFMGDTKLIYTRTLEGRKKLIKARIHSLGATEQKKSERISVWK